MHTEYKFLIAYLVVSMTLLGLFFIKPTSTNCHNDPLMEAQNEFNRVYIMERGAEDDASDKALSEHQEVNYVRCFLRPAGYVTCQVHTPPSDVEAQCRARGPREFLVDGNRCRWTSPSSMAHP